MITKRDLSVAAITMGLTLTFVIANSKINNLDSSIYDWNDIAVKETKTGTVRTFFRSPTAKLWMNSNATSRRSIRMKHLILRTNIRKKKLSSSGKVLWKLW